MRRVLTAPYRTRRARSEDARSIAALLVELCAGRADLAREAAAAALRRGTRGHEAWIATWRQMPVAVVALAPAALPGARVGYVEWLAVDAAHRRHGLGAAMLRVAKRRAQIAGWRQLHVCTFHTNRAALALYIDCGFHPAATLCDYVAPGVHYVQLVWPVSDKEGEP